MRNSIITVVYTLMLLVAIGNIILMFHLMDTQGRKLLHYGIIILAAWFIGLVLTFMHDGRHTYRLANWVLMALVLGLIYPPCVLWNALTMPFWFARARGLRWYTLTSAGAVSWMGETWLIGKVDRLNSWLEARITYGRHA
jgi:MFS family permease